jgi:multidrug resistance protein MdtO
MATLAQALPQSLSRLNWVKEFLKQELAPYPGRTAIVTRMVVSATLIMIVCMTFRIPYSWLGAIYALLVSRESSLVTLQSLTTIFSLTALGAIYVLVSMFLVVSFPMLHFLWVIVTLFLTFFAISVLTQSMAATALANLVVIAMPLWDRHVPAETNVAETLWLCLAVLVAVVITSGVELAFVRLPPGDEIIMPINRRLVAIEELLACYAEGRVVDAALEKRIDRFEMLGTSMLRHSLRHSDYSSQLVIAAGGVTALVGRLVDVAASLTQVTVQPTGNDQKRFRNLVSTLASIRNDFSQRRIPALVQFPAGEEQTRVPLLTQVENLVTQIPQVLVGSGNNRDHLPSSEDLPRNTFLVRDALANPDHIRFALRGCLAASSCYLIYNVIAWPGISTAVTTCLLTALSTIGSSRQKQILRLTGAIVGGFVLGMGSQIFILPYVDSIAGFTVLFVAVTALASWLATSSPRLSYSGVQLGLAFYLVNTSEFKLQTSLAVARDRVVGILLGLFMMWLVFDRLWSSPAAVEMKRTFVSNLRLLAQFAREPVSDNARVAIAKNFALRETFNSRLDDVRSLADGVLLEFGPSREQDLALRDRIRRWQMLVRMLFITRIVLWKYRVQLPGFELTEPVAAAQRDIDNNLALALEDIADRMEERRSSGERPTLETSITRLERTVENYRSEEPQQTFAAQFGALLALNRRVQSLMTSLNKEM